MKQLNKIEKENLKNLTQHAGFKVLEEIAKDFEIDTLRRLKTINLANKDELALLNAQQNFLLGAESLIEIIKTQTNVMVNKKFDK